MRLRKLLFILITIVYMSQIGLAGEQIVLSPQAGHSNQEQINEAITQAASGAKGSTVFLTAGVYPVDNTIIMRSNVRLLGDRDAIIQVSSTSSQWFTGRTGVISCKESLKNVEICGFQIDGNIGNLPTNYANSQPGRYHDCEKLIIVGGYSNDLAGNIKIHDLKLYNAFSDGIYVIYAQDVKVYNNFISNCQHEGIYFSVVRGGGHIYNNKIAGITSDCARLDNCKKCLIEYNLFFSYGGNSYGAYKNGQNGLQIGDAGSSKGYNAVKKGYPTEDIEVRFNTFSDPGLKAIWYHGGKNVYIHDNEFKDASILETMGIPIGDISVDNPPSVEMSEKVFSSIFDILDVKFTDTGRTEQTPEEFDYQIAETEQGKIAGGIKILGFNNWITINNESYISSPDDTIVKTSIIRNPSLKSWSGNISKVDKNVSVTIQNGTVKATLTAKVNWYNLKKNSDGKYVQRYDTSEYKFTDVYSPAPKVFESPFGIQGIVYQYPTYFTLYVPSEWLTSIEYTYDGNTSEHILLVGEKNSTTEGVEYTEYSELEHWDGKLQHQSKWVYINGIFDKSKLNVTAHTPYEEITVNNFKIVKKDFPKRAIANWLAPFVWTMIIIGIGIWYLWRQIWY